MRAVDAPGSPAAAELAREGLLPGSAIIVTSRSPLGGPVVIALGRARLAISADVASLVLTDPCPPGGAADPRGAADPWGPGDPGSRAR